VDRKGAREPIATGPQRRGKRIERSAEPVANKPAAKPEVTPKAKPKPKQIAKTEPKPEPEVAPTPEPEPEPELEPEPEVTPAGAVEVEVFYETGEFALSSDDEAALQEVVEWLKANPKGKLVIEGHTDPVGSTARNKTLSLKRAKAVRAFLTSEAGVPNSRFELRGYGEGNLHYPRNSPKNRRIVVRSR
jgi:OOP family OmpA-OmpF porin